MYIEKYNIPVSDGDENKLAFYVSPGEYPIYETEQYQFMQEDTLCEEAYLEAMKKIVRGKRVLDIGTGENMDWAMYAIDFWAKESVGIEMIPSVYEKAKASLNGHEYEKFVSVVNALSTEYTPKKKFDVIISEIIGTIGGSEGAGVCLKDAQERLLAENGKMIPYSCTTLVGGVCIREVMPELQFIPEALNKIEQIFQFNGKEFDLRLTLSFNTPEALITDKGELERLDFFKPNFDFLYHKELSLEVIKDSNFDGLLLWINLLAEENGIMVDSLEEETAWEVVYIPIFDEPVKLTKGDKIQILFISNLSEDGIHPDYSFFIKTGNHSGSFKSLYKGNEWQSKQIYKDLFKLK